MGLRTSPVLRLGASILIVAIATAAQALEDPSAGPAYLVRNIATGPDREESSDPRGFVAAGDLVFFTANDGEHGRELWRTDGTPAGTQLVRDIAAGPDDAFRWYDELVAFGDLVGFWDDDGQFWRSDGTAEGTFPLAERALSAVAAGDKVFFYRDYQDDYTLWMSDGSRDGTVPVRTFVDVDEDHEGLTLLAGPNHLYAWVWIDDWYAWSHPEAHPRIWATEYSKLLNPTSPPQAAPTVDLPVGVPREDWSFVRSFAGDALVFLASTKDVASATEDDAVLWRSDGTASGTYPLLEGAPGLFRLEDFQTAPHLTRADGHIFFIADDGAHGFEPWVTDGTREGTREYADLIPGPVGLFPCRDDEDWECQQREGSAGVNLIPDETGLLIARTFWDAADNPSTDLWKSDGSPNGTRRLEDVVPRASLSRREYTAGRDAALIFSVWNGDQSEIWYGDGTLSGSRRVAAVGARGFIEAANGFVFPVWDPAGAQGEPWWSDGTPEGTYLLRDIRPGDASSAPRDLTDLNGVLLFSAEDREHGRELWRSDGSDAGTELVADIQVGAAGSEPAEIVRFGDAVFFTADDGIHGAELWRSDGSAAGTVLVSDIRAGEASARPHRISVAGGALYFFADDGAHGIELWRSDGSAAGTRLVVDVNPQGDACEYAFEGACYSWEPHESYIAEAQGAIYFAAYDGVHGTELWRSGGPGGTTELVADIGPGSDSSSPHGLLAFDGNVYFNVSWDATTKTDNALWRTDGNGATVPLRPPLLRLDTSAHVIGAELVAVAPDLSGGLALWRLDALGEQSATPLPFYENERFQTPVGAGGSIFLTGYADLWRSDVGVLAPDAYYYCGSSANFTSLTNVAGKLIFAARDHWTDNLTELWTADGLPWGTRRLQSIPPTEHSSSSYGDLSEPTFVVSGDRVFFAADSGGTGLELWALPLDALPDVEPIPSPTATVTPPAEEVATPTPTPTAEATATLRPACPLDGDPPGCARLEVRDVAAAAGDTVALEVALRTRGEAVAGVQADLHFDPRLKVVRKANGAPLCTVNDAIRKEATVFAFAPPTCAGGGGTCSTVRSLVLSIANLDTIADGATLFTCQVEIPTDTPAGSYPVTASAVLAASPDAAGFAIGTRDGAVDVAARTARNLESATPDSGACSIQQQAAPGWLPIAPGLLGLALLLKKRAPKV